jgi:hypothetical protein
MNGKPQVPFFSSACGSPLNENAQYKLKPTARLRPSDELTALSLYPSRSSVRWCPVFSDALWQVAAGG